MKSGMAAVFEAAEQFEQGQASKIESMLSMSTQLILRLMDWSWLNDRLRLDYLRFFEYGQGPGDRFRIRNGILKAYEDLLQFNPPNVIKTRLLDIIAELWTVPIGPYNSLLFVPDRWWDRKAAEIKKAGTQVDISLRIEFWVRNVGGERPVHRT